jgi:hypothetical protein
VGVKGEEGERKREGKRQNSTPRGEHPGNSYPGMKPDMQELSVYLSSQLSFCFGCPVRRAHGAWRALCKGVVA